MKTNSTALTAQLLSALPMLAYPAVLVANAMQAAALADASQRDTGSRASRWLTGAFLVGTTAYPLVWLASRALASRANGKAEWAWSVAPLGFLSALAALFALAVRAEGNG